MANEFIARNGLISLNNSVITGSLNVTNGITGSHLGTSSWATNALTSSNIQGGSTNYIPVWNSSTSISSSVIYQTGSKIYIGTLPSTQSIAQLSLSDNEFIVGTAQAYSTYYGTGSEGIFQVTRVAPYQTQVWLRPAGNASGYNSNYWGLIEQNTSYLVIQPGNYHDLQLRAGANSNVSVLTSGSATDKLRITGNGKVLINTNTNTDLYYLDVNGATRLQGKLTISANGFDATGNSTITGSLGVTAGITATLTGTASWATSASSAISSSYSFNATSASFASTASFYGGGVTSASYASSSTSASYASSSTSASYASSSTSASYASSSTSASFASTASYVITSQTASYVATASNALNADLLDGVHLSTLATTGSNIFKANQTITGSLDITGSINTIGTITATTLVVQTITSSTDFITGSSRFGSLISNTHTFTGSVFITGSLTTTGSVSATAFTGSLFGTSSWAISASWAPGGSSAATFPYTGSAIISGSLTITGSLITTGGASGSFSGSFFGNGAGLTGVVASATPAGPNKSIQFNDAGTTSGSGTFTFDKTTNLAILTGSLDIKSSTYGSTILEISGSNNNPILAISDITGSSNNILTISTGSTTYASMDSGGTFTSSIATNALYYGILSASISTDQNDYSPAGWDSSNPNKKTVISISGSTSVKITGLTGGIDGRIAVFQNDSSDFIVILEDQSASSQAANRFDFRNPIFLVPNGTITLIYDGHSQRWEPIGSSGGIGFGSFFDDYEEFLGDIGRWGTVASGTGAATAISTYLQNTTERPIGIWRGQTGSTATGRANIGSTQASSIFPGYGQAICLARIAVETASSAAQRTHTYVGWHNGVGQVSASNGIFWKYSDQYSTSWLGSAHSSSFTAYTAISGAAADTNYIWLGIHNNSTWTRSTFFYSTDSITWTIAGVVSGSNMPSSASSTGFGVSINKITGSSAAGVSVDILAHRYDLTRG